MVAGAAQRAGPQAVPGGGGRQRVAGPCRHDVDRQPALRPAPAAYTGRRRRSHGAHAGLGAGPNRCRHARQPAADATAHRSPPPDPCPGGASRASPAGGRTLRRGRLGRRPAAAARGGDPQRPPGTGCRDRRPAASRRAAGARPALRRRHCAARRGGRADAPAGRLPRTVSRRGPWQRGAERWRICGAWCEASCGRCAGSR